MRQRGNAADQSQRESDVKETALIHGCNDSGDFNVVF